MISSHLATRSLQESAYTAFSLATLLCRSMLVLLKCMLISIRDAYSLARSAIDSFALRKRVNSETCSSASLSLRARLRASASDSDSFYFS